MTQDQVIRAWKNPSFRAGLSAAEQKALPANPAGVVDLNERELTEVSGGTTPLCVGIIIGLTITIVANP
jgi:mersacidin/lichenicidin family type 2 lantibiotic